MNQCANDPAWAVETAQATGMSQTCPGCTEQAKKAESTGGTWASFVWVTG